MDVLGSDHKVFKVRSPLKLQSFVLPELPKVHVHCEVLEEMLILGPRFLCTLLFSPGKGTL